MGFTIRQLHQLHLFFGKKSEIEIVTTNQLHQLQGKKKFKDSILGLTVSQLHQLHWIFRKKSEIETVTASQLHQLQAKKFKHIRFSA